VFESKPSKWIWKFVFQFFLSSGDWKPPKSLLFRISKFSFWRNLASKKHAGLGTYNGHLPTTHNFLTRASKEIRDDGTKIRSSNQRPKKEMNEQSERAKRRTENRSAFACDGFLAAIARLISRIIISEVPVVVVRGSLQISRRTLLRFVAEAAKVFLQEFVLFDLSLSFSFLSLLSSSSREELMRCVGACFWGFFTCWKNLKALL
jgi:hypothetical protein